MDRAGLAQPQRRRRPDDRGGHCLLDELVLLIHPVIAGQGRRKLFADDTALTKLDLVSALPTSSGVIIATYRPAS